MNEMTLFESFNAVDEELLERSECKLQKRRYGRVFRAAIAAAAILASFSIVVAASPTLRGWIFGVKVESVTAPSAEGRDDGAVFRDGFLTLTPEVEMDASAPGTIETFYAPTYLIENWKPGRVEFSSAGKADLEELVSAMRHDGTSLWWDDPETETGANFCQYARRKGSGSKLRLNLGYAKDYELMTVTFAGQNMVCVAVPASDIQSENGIVARQSAFRILIWSDGSYLYTLRLDERVSDETAERIIRSLEPVDDILACQEWEFGNP